MRLTSLLCALSALLCLSRCGTTTPPDHADTLLRLLPAGKTGIDFSNRLMETEALNILTYEYFYNGAGVGIGDVNNDSLPDIFFTANQVPCRLYLNEGQFRFRDVTADAGIRTDGKWATGVSMVDINGDGWLDIYVCFSGPQEAPERANAFFLNNRDGTFTDRAAEMGLADTGHSIQAAFFDYDQDGDLDMYLLTNTIGRTGPNIIRPKSSQGEHPNTDRLYENQDGHFVDVSRRAGIRHEGFGLGVSVTDIDQDGRPDIYVSNDYLSDDLLYRNNGDGTFTDMAPVFFRHTSYSAMGNDVADINNDGRPDIVTVDMLPPDNLRRKLMIGSIRYDRFRSEQTAGYRPQFMRNTLQLNQGAAPDGSVAFSEIGQLAGIASTDWSWSPLLGDLDNDGWKDLLITNGYPRDITNLDFSAYKMHTLRQEQYTRGTQASLLEALEGLEGAYLPNVVFQNQGDLRFTDRSADWGFTQPSYSHGAALGDLDRDGDLDYVVNNTNAPAFVYENRAAERHHWLRIRLDGPSGNRQAIGSKVTLWAGGSVQQLALYPVRGYQSSIEPVLHAGLGNQATVDSFRIEWPDGSIRTLYGVASGQELSVGYAPTDVRLPEPPAKPFWLEDLTAAAGLDWRHRETHYADFKVSPLLPHKHSQSGPCIAVGDMDGDGRDDFFVGGAFRQSGSLFFQRPDGTFLARDLAPGDNFPEDLGSCLFDADGDGDLDLYVTSGGSEFAAESEYYQDRLYRNDGRGHFREDPAALPRIPTSTACVVAGDFDRDGDQDLFVGGRIIPGRYAEIPRSYVLENRNGEFVDVTEKYPLLREVGRVTAAAWADLDGDAAPELVLAGEWMPVLILYSRDGFNSLDTVPGTTGWWNSLTVANLDADPELEIVAGNLGRNNPFHPAPRTPLRLYVQDLDGDGRKDAVLSFHLQGQEVPVHFRNDLLNWFSGLKQRFPDYRSYAQAQMTDIFPDLRHGDGEVASVTDFSTVWLDRQQGKWTVHPLPVPAQFAPVQACAILDVDRDGRQDLLLSGNSTAADPQTGHYDAMNGCLLLGDGQGGFRPTEAGESGWYLPGNGTDLQVIRLADGRTGVLAALNDDRIRLFSLMPE